MTSACRTSSPLSNPSNTNITFMNQKYLHTEPWVHWSPSDNVKFHIFLLPQQSHGLCKQLGSARHSCASRVSFRRPVCHRLDTVWQIKKNVVSESCSHIGADQRDTWRICLCVWSGVWCRGTRSVTCKNTERKAIMSMNMQTWQTHFASLHIIQTIHIMFVWQ